MNKERKYKITDNISLEKATKIAHDSARCDEYFNFPSIMTALIKKAAECERFSSDIIIDLMSINNKIKHNAIRNETMYFGFREQGVDSNTFINTGLRINEYFTMYALKIELSDDNTIDMTLYDVPKDSYQHKVKSFITITETLSRTVCIEHTPDESPEYIVEKLRNQEKIVLTADDFVDYDLEDVTSDVDPADQKYYQFFPME